MPCEGSVVPSTRRPVRDEVGRQVDRDPCACPHRCRHDPHRRTQRPARPARRPGAGRRRGAAPPTSTAFSAPRRSVPACPPACDATCRASRHPWRSAVWQGSPRGPRRSAAGGRPIVRWTPRASDPSTSVRWCRRCRRSGAAPEPTAAQRSPTGSPSPRRPRPGRDARTQSVAGAGSNRGRPVRRRVGSSGPDRPPGRIRRWPDRPRPPASGGPDAGPWWWCAD